MGGDPEKAWSELKLREPAPSTHLGSYGGGALFRSHLERPFLVSTYSKFLIPQGLVQSCCSSQTSRQAQDTLRHAAP